MYKADESYVKINRRAMDRETVGETGCLEPTFKQNTNDYGKTFYRELAYLFANYFK